MFVLIECTIYREHKGKKSDDCYETESSESYENMNNNSWHLLTIIARWCPNHLTFFFMACGSTGKLRSFIISLHIPETSLLSNTWFVSICSHSVAWLDWLLICICESCTFYSREEQNVITVFINIALCKTHCFMNVPMHV